MAVGQEGSKKNDTAGELLTYQLASCDSEAIPNWNLVPHPPPRERGQDKITCAAKN